MVAIDNREFVEIKIANASEIEGQSIPEAPCFIDLSGSNLPQYLTSNYVMPDEPEEQKSHSTDPNSENAEGNDYGDTPSSSRKDSDSDQSDDRSEDDENERRLKRLMKLMDKNKPTDSDEEDYNFDTRGKKKKGYVNVAQDAWYNRDEYDDDY